MAAAPPGASRYWSVVQGCVLLAAVALVGALLVAPAVGLVVLWNVLIPAAPALVVVAPGLWRNVCPMATVSLLPRRLGHWRRRVPSPRAIGILYLLSVAALSLAVMLRHAVFDTGGPSSAGLLVAASTVAFAMGLVYEGRSGWCTSLCPIHSVEKLYARAPAFTLPNARCASCRRCTTPCPDSTPGMTSVRSRSPLGRRVGTVMTGGFAGFVWGWFHVPDYSGAITAVQLVTCLAWPLAGAAASSVAYLAARAWLAPSESALQRLDNAFAAAAVSAYYWYRLPALIGFNAFHDAGLLYDLSGGLPSWTPFALRALTTPFFFWFLVVRNSPGRTWMVRPATIPLATAATGR